jgi:hypothetical protein
MAQKNDWFANSRPKQLSQAKRWDVVLAEKPDGTTTNAAAWGISQADATTFHTHIGIVETLLNTVEGPNATATILPLKRSVARHLSSSKSLCGTYTGILPSRALRMTHWCLWACRSGISTRHRFTCRIPNALARRAIPVSTKWR